MFKYIAATLVIAFGGAWVSAQTVVPVGVGSYASYPPSQANAGTIPTQAPSYLVANNGMPIPSNKWWMDLMVHQYAGNMWAQPLTVSADAQGINIYNPINWVPSGTAPQLALDYPIAIRGQGFSPADARALRWGDWTVSFRMQQATNQFMDATFGHGLPSAWIEFTGVQPQIAFPGGTATFFDDNGNALSLPIAANHFGIAYGSRYWGVFAPDNTQFVLSNGTINVTFVGTNTFLVVGALPAKSNLSYFAQFAYAVPQDSQMNWAYDPSAGTVTTSWHLTTRQLQGVEPRVIQGWLAHHYRSTVNNLAFNGINYSTARGPMKCSTGTDFQIVYGFNGILPTLPPPSPVGRTNDYDPARMNSYLTSVAANTSVAPDTYWGGKDLLRYAQHMAMAHDLGRPEFSTLQNTARSALQNWYTYTPGESTYYFATYPAWKALVGFQASYGSDQFNDHHFHYGYFTHATALVGMYDQNFLTNYGPMARLVAKEYANWERSDTNFPFLRTFDIWAGHSQASGFPDATRGGNQESSGEAMNSWGGLFLLGAMMGDDPMRAAGAMGYVMESTAVREYWFNEHGDVWPAVYNRSVVGILWDNGQEYQTYFGLNPIYVHGIQWLPISPTMSYLAQNPAFAQQQFNNMMAEQLASLGNNSISSMGSQWGNYALWYALQFNPDYVAAQMDQLWASNDAVATDAIYAGATYYFTHAYRKLGAIQWQFHISVPTSAVYYNTNTALYTYVAYNPQSNAQMATVYSNQVPVGTLVLPALTLLSTNFLTGGSGTIPLTVAATSPSANQTGVATGLSQVSLTFNQNVSAASMAATRMSGANVTGLIYSQGDGTPTITFSIKGALQPSQTYTVTIPAATTVAGGTNTLGSDYSFSFTTTAPPPPLAVVSTLPSAGQTNIASGTSQIMVAFNQNVAAASLASTTMTGSNMTGLTYSQGDGTPMITFNINGALQPLQAYTVTIPAATTVAVGTNTLGSDYAFSFTTAAVLPSAPNPVLNPGFETAGTDPSLAENWTVSQAAGGPVSAVRTNSNPHSGAFNFEVHLASTGAGPVVEFTQVGVPVAGGTTNPFTFCADALAGSAGENAQWRILWNAGGDTGYQGFAPGNNAYAVISNTVVAPATATSATLFFHFAGAASLTQTATIDLDDVSLSTVSNSSVGPTTNVAAATVGQGVAISWPTLVQSNYVVQGSADLTTNGGWTNLSANIVGNGTTNSLFDSFGTNPHRFYRVQQSP